VATKSGLSALSDHTPDWRAREEEIARIAGRQHGLLTLAQLVGAGLSKSGVRDRTRTGRLHRVHRGVYSLGRPPERALEHWMAAVLACGLGSALSHAAGAANLGIRPSAATLVDVTSPAGAGRGQRGIRAHRSRLEPEEVALVNGIPTTTCARTLLDLAEVLHPEALAKTIDQAEILRLLDLADVRRVLASNPGRHGHRALRAQLSGLDPLTKHARNEFERRFLKLVEAAGLPRPEVNTTVHLEGRVLEPDFLWRRERVIVETDGWETHGTRQAFERDRAKDQLLLRAGYRVIRVTWLQLEHEAHAVLATLRAALAT
jgi:very-short-patch-repair endonuclease